MQDDNGFRPQRERRFNGGFGQTEKHDAVCTECSASCQVPFKPTEGKPVYCRDCFRKKKPRY